MSPFGNPASRLEKPSSGNGFQTKVVARRDPFCRVSLFLSSGRIIDGRRRGRTTLRDSVLSSPTPASTLLELPLREQCGFGLPASAPMSDVSASACANGVCGCGAQEHTVDDINLQCPIYRPPHGLHGLTVLDDQTIEWLLNSCPEIYWGLAADSNNSLKPRRRFLIGGPLGKNGWWHFSVVCWSRTNVILLTSIKQNLVTRVSPTRFHEELRNEAENWRIMPRNQGNTKFPSRSSDHFTKSRHCRLASNSSCRLRSS